MYIIAPFPLFWPLSMVVVVPLLLSEGTRRSDPIHIVIFYCYTHLCRYMYIHVYHLTVSSVLTIVNGSSRASAAERGHTQVRSCTNLCPLWYRSGRRKQRHRPTRTPEQWKARSLLSAGGGVVLRVVVCGVVLVVSCVVVFVCCFLSCRVLCYFLCVFVCVTWAINNAIITLKQTACRCPTVGATAPAAIGGRRAGVWGGH